MPETLLTLVWDAEKGHVIAVLPDDPKASAVASAPTGFESPVPAVDLPTLLSGLPKDAGNHVRSLVRQAHARAHREADEAHQVHQRTRDAETSASDYVEALDEAR